MKSSTMRAVEISAPGGPGVLRPVERPVPKLGPGEVLIRVRAAGVNAPDLLQRRGLYPVPPGAPDIPGLEVAGTIVETAPDVAAPALGAEVCALVAGGGYAEYCAAAAPLCLPYPPRSGAVEAAGAPETVFTVWTNVFERGGLQAGETLLVHGGASGIGTMAIQLARALGAGVLATAGSDEKCAACVALGAERAINHRREDFVAAVAEATGGRGVDVVLDMVAGDYIPRNVACLAPGGRLVIIGLQHGGRAELDFGLVLRRHLTVTGSTLRPRPVAEKARIAAAVRDKVWPWFAAGKVRVVIDSTYPLAEAAAAHARLETRDHVGKVVLTV